MPHLPKLILVLTTTLLLTSCLSTAVGVTTGTVKLAAKTAALPVKAGVALVTDEDDDED